MPRHAIRFGEDLTIVWTARDFFTVPDGVPYVETVNLARWACKAGEGDTQVPGVYLGRDGDTLGRHARRTTEQQWDTLTPEQQDHLMRTWI